MSTATWSETLKKSRRVHWKTHEKEWLAKQVGRSLLRQGVNLLTDDLDDYIMEPLREAISQLLPEKRRYIGGPSQVRWLVPMLRDMAGAREGYPSKYDANVLDEPESSEVANELEDQEEQESSQYQSDYSYDHYEPTHAPEGYVLIPQRDWAKTNRTLKGLRLRLDNLADTIDTQTQLFLEVVGQLAAAPKEILPESPAVPTSQEGSSLPLVIIAGLRERDYRHIQEKVEDFAEVVFVDTRRKSPERLGQCDWLVMTRFCGETWIKKGLNAYQGRASVVNSLTGVVKEINRLFK